MKLRKYQQEAEDNIFRLWGEGKRRLVGRGFTAFGKTVLFASVIKRLKKRALVIAHRKELIFQAREKIEIVTGMKFQIEMGDYRARNNFKEDLFNPANECEAGVVASIQTLSAGGDGLGRMTKFLPTDFDLLIGDEFHHFTSPQCQRVMDYFLQNPNLKILGVTATPNRADEESLSQIADEKCFDYDMNYGIDEGWLAQLDSQSIHVESLDFSKIKIVLGDLNQGQLSKVMESEKPLYGIASSTIDIAGDKRGIGFSPSVEHARKMADIFNRHKSGSAAFVHGKTDPEERKKINADFANGCINWIWNCGTHTEGFDDSGVEVIVPKPTKSKSLLEQMIGRGTRPHESIAHRLGNIDSAALRRSMIARSCKPTCLILEHYGNRYDLATAFDILGGKITEQTVKDAIATARKSGNRVRITKSIEDEEKIAEEKKKRETEEAAKKAKIIVPANYKIQKFDPFNILNIHAAQPRFEDVKKQLTPKMCETLQKAGINPENLTYAEGKQICGHLINRRIRGLCTFKQVKKLKEFGIDASVFTFEQADGAFKYLDAHGWRRSGNNYNPIQKRMVPVRRVEADPF